MSSPHSKAPSSPFPSASTRNKTHKHKPPKPPSAASRSIPNKPQPLTQLSEPQNHRTTHDHKSPTSSSPSDRGRRAETPEEQHLRKARLALAAQLREKKPRCPLLRRLDPETGRVLAGQDGFAGTTRKRNPKDRYVNPKGPKGAPAGESIREEDEEVEEMEMDVT